MHIAKDTSKQHMYLTCSTILKNNKIITICYSCHFENNSLVKYMAINYALAIFGYENVLSLLFCFMIEHVENVD